MYKLFTDKNEHFTADVSVKNASLKNSTARLIVESGDLNLVFKGAIENQKCSIPIKKLKGILDENTTGKMYLEIIVEDIYFKPWESDFIVEEHTSMKVVVQEQTISDKPILEVVVAQPIQKEIKKEVVTEHKTVKKIEKKNDRKAILEKKKLLEAIRLDPADELVGICKKIGLSEGNASKSDMLELLTEYFKTNPSFVDRKEVITRDFLKKVGFSTHKE